MRRAVLAACASIAISTSVVGEDGTTVCDIEVEPQLKNWFYTVTVNGKPFKDKRYIDYSDAVQLRDVLIQTGLCWRPKTLRKCEVQPLGPGQYTVARAGATFDPTAVFGTPDRARKRALKLAAANLCFVE